MPANSYCRKNSSTINSRLSLVLLMLSLVMSRKAQAFLIPTQPFRSHLVTSSTKLSASSSAPTRSTAPTPTGNIKTVQPVQPVQPQKKSKKQQEVSLKNQSLVRDLRITIDPSIEDFDSYFDFIDGGISGPSAQERIDQRMKRPRGRPSSVPGAMSRSRLKNMNDVKNGEASARVLNTAISNGSSVVDLFETTYVTDDKESNKEPVAKKKRGRGRPRKNEVLSTFHVSKENKSIDLVDSMNSGQMKGKGSIDNLTSVKAKTSQKKKRVKTNLPPTRNKSERDNENKSTGMMSMIKDFPNLQKYYRTKLLTAHEEYSFGMKVQFLMKSEHVHEGLERKLSRTPSLVEWATACGFVEDGLFEIDEDSDLIAQIRPVNKDKSSLLDPNMFVGNGLVNESGPGRGKGRVKAPPPTSLNNFYDDTECKFGSANGECISKTNLRPINRGSPDNFLEMMLEGKEAKQKMIQCNMRLVVSISKRYKHVGVNIADLVQEGSIGLSRAAEKFEPQMGFKFSTYASWWIQQAVFRAIAYHSRTIRLPVHVHNLLNRMRRVRQQLQHEGGESASNEVMAKELGLTLEKYNKMLRLTRRAISLDIAKYQQNPKDIGQESDTLLGDSLDTSEVIEDESTPEQNVSRGLFRDDLTEMMKALEDDERLVINARYGLKDGLTRTVTTVAAEMGQTKSWVRSKESRGLRKLRRPWYEKRLWEHQNSLLL